MSKGIQVGHSAAVCYLDEHTDVLDMCELD